MGAVGRAGGWGSKLHFLRIWSHTRSNRMKDSLNFSKYWHEVVTKLCETMLCETKLCVCVCVYIEVK